MVSGDRRGQAILHIEHAGSIDELAERIAQNVCEELYSTIATASGVARRQKGLPKAYPTHSVRSAPGLLVFTSGGVLRQALAMSEAERKHCPTCGDDLPRTAFSKDRSAEMG